jgi:hypothetical protein
MTAAMSSKVILPGIPLHSDNPFLLIAVAGWMNQRQRQMIEYLREENRVLREQLGERRLRFNDDQRRRLAAKAKGLGRKLLTELATVVTPDLSELGHFSESKGRWCINPVTDKLGACGVALPDPL